MHLSWLLSKCEYVCVRVVLYAFLYEIGQIIQETHNYYMSRLKHFRFMCICGGCYANAAGIELLFYMPVFLQIGLLACL